MTCIAGDFLRGIATVKGTVADWKSKGGNCVAGLGCTARHGLATIAGQSTCSADAADLFLDPQHLRRSASSANEGTDTLPLVARTLMFDLAIPVNAPEQPDESAAESRDVRDRRGA